MLVFTVPFAPVVHRPGGRLGGRPPKPRATRPTGLLATKETAAAPQIRATDTRRPGARLLIAPAMTRA